MSEREIDGQQTLAQPKQNYVCNVKTSRVETDGSRDGGVWSWVF
jgi:hypothetical protein